MKVRFIMCISLLLALAWPALVQAEDIRYEDNRRTYRYEVQGIVTDENGQPLPGATVRVQGTTLGAGTNSEGQFVLRFEDTKVRNLIVSFVGYKPQACQATPSESPSEVLVQMHPAANPLDEVVVTGSYLEKPLKDVPVLTRVISQKEIQALNPVSFESLLQYSIPGLQIGYNSMSGLPKITYQGMGGEYVLFLIDGERVSGEGSDHNVDFTRFNVDDIERIEVIKGAQSTIYGSNALGGVINIITKSSTRPITANINARYAGTNGQKYTASGGINKNRFSTFTSLTHRRMDSYKLSDTAGKVIEVEDANGNKTYTEQAAYSTTINGYKAWDFTQKLGYSFNEKLKVDLKGTYYHNKYNEKVGRLFRDIFSDYTVGGKMKYLPGEGQQLVVSYLYDNYKKDKDFFLANRTRTDYRNVNHTPKADYSGIFGNHTISAGFEGDFEYLKHYMMKDSADASSRTLSLYAQEDWLIVKNLNVIAGVRGDYHQQYHWHVSPKISVMWKPWNVLTLRAGYAQGFRSPSLKELYEDYDMGGLGMFRIYGNKDLKPETSKQYSVAAEVNRGGFNASVSLVHNNFNNRITMVSLPVEPGQNYPNQQYVNAETSKAMSVESIVRYSWKFGLVLTGSYVYTDDYQEKLGRNISTVRPHSVTFGVMYNKRFGKVGVNAALNGQWVSKMDIYSYNDEKKTFSKEFYEPRTMCSMNMGVTLPRGISLNGGIDNLLNFKDKSANASVQTPQRGISFVGTLNINLADMFKL